MAVDILSLLSFALITTFTPGPNNISSASMGLMYGYKTTFKYLTGIASGFFLIMCLCGYISSGLLKSFPEVEKILAIAGSLYILWLAWHSLKANYNFDENEQKPFGFIKGLLLQLLNPKVIIYGLTIYSTFLKGIPRGSMWLAVSALFFAILSFCSISTWTLSGALIRKYMEHRRVKLTINIILSLMLVLTAVKISGILDLLNI